MYRTPSFTASAKDADILEEEEVQSNEALLRLGQRD